MIVIPLEILCFVLCYIISELYYWLWNKLYRSKKFSIDKVDAIFYYGLTLTNWITSIPLKLMPKQNIESLINYSTELGNTELVYFITRLRCSTFYDILDWVRCNL